MILAVADYAERREGASPPPELTQALRTRRYPGALPFSGSLGDQPAGLLDRLEYALWTYDTVQDFSTTKLKWPAWKEKNPQGWKLVMWIKKRRESEAENAANE